MKQILLVAVLGAAATLPTHVLAKADCKAYPKAEWMSEADARAKIEAQAGNYQAVLSSLDALEAAAADYRSLI